MQWNVNVKQIVSTDPRVRPPQRATPSSARIAMAGGAVDGDRHLRQRQARRRRQHPGRDGTLRPQEQRYPLLNWILFFGFLTYFSQVIAVVNDYAFLSIYFHFKGDPRFRKEHSFFSFELWIVENTLDMMGNNRAYEIQEKSGMDLSHSTWICIRLSRKSIPSFSWSSSADFHHVQGTFWTWWKLFPI